MTLVLSLLQLTLIFLFSNNLIMHVNLFFQKARVLNHNQLKLQRNDIKIKCYIIQAVR